MLYTYRCCLRVDVAQRDDGGCSRVYRLPATCQHVFLLRQRTSLLRRRAISCHPFRHFWVSIVLAKAYHSQMQHQHENHTLNVDVLCVPRVMMWM